MQVLEDYLEAALPCLPTSLNGMELIASSPSLELMENPWVWGPASCVEGVVWCGSELNHLRC